MLYNAEHWLAGFVLVIRTQSHLQLAQLARTHLASHRTEQVRGSGVKRRLILPLKHASFETIPN